MKLLKQKGSGEIYVWTEQLAQRPDMEEFERTPPEPVKEEPVIKHTESFVYVEAAPVEERPARKTRGSLKKALAAKAAELSHDDQVPGA